MELKETLKEIVENHLPGEDLFLVDLVLKGTDEQRKVLVLIDGDNGVSIDACAQVSRAVGAEIEEKELIESHFTLEVSSPGLDHPIMLYRQYVKNIGRSIKVAMKDGAVAEGKLLKVEDQGVFINKKIGEGKKSSFEEVFMPFSAINKSMVLVSFK